MAPGLKESMVDCRHCLPVGALLSLVVAVVGVIEAQAVRGEVHARLEAALAADMGESAHLRDRLVSLELWAVVLVDALAFGSISLARCGYNLAPPPRRFGKLVGCLARPPALSAEWALACGTFAVQVALLSVYACFFQLFRLLAALCRTEQGSCAGPVGSEVQTEFPGLDAQRYCDSGLGGGGADLLFVVGCLMTVVGQGLMASSLHAEWERVSEELHYHQLPEAETAALSHPQHTQPPH